MIIIDKMKFFVFFFNKNVVVVYGKFVGYE